MPTKRLARRPRYDDGKELGRNGGNEGSDDEEEESGEDAIPAEPKEMPPKRTEQPSPPSPEDAGAQGSGEASPARSAPRAVAALKTKTMTKRVKKPSPASQEEEEDEAGDASPASDPLLPDDTADARHNMRGGNPKRGEKRSPPPQQEEERPEKLAAGPDGETVAASAPQRKKKSKRSADEGGLEKKKKKQQEKKITEQEHASDTSPPHDRDMQTAHGEELQGKEVADQEHADDASPSEDNRDKEDGETGAQVNAEALQGTEGRNAPSTKPRSSERSWSYDDELKILNALVVHARSHDGALPDSSHLVANLTFDKIDVNEDKLNDKILKLRRRYQRVLLQDGPSNDQLFKLSEILWGQADEYEQVEPTFRDFSALSKTYPHLAKEVKAYAETHSSGDLIMARFMTIGDEKARHLDAKCKKQHIEAFKLVLGQASLTNELLSELSSLTRVRF